MIVVNQGSDHAGGSVGLLPFRTPLWKSSLLSGRAGTSRASLRSHSRRSAGAVLAHFPTAKECTIPPHLFRVLLLERLHAKEHAVVFVVCIHISRPIGNRGWQAIEVPKGWFNVIRGLRQRRSCRRHRAFTSRGGSGTMRSPINHNAIEGSIIFSS